MATGKNTHRCALATAALLTTLIPGMQAAAQEDSANEVLDEITVTARHRAENIQNIPIAATAIGAGVVDENRSNTLQELENLVPNLVFGETGSSGETHVGIRGIGDFSRNIGFDTRVGVYIDGVFAGQSLSVDQGLVDLAQIEVLRGPQGTLFGKNSSSGIINISSNKPDPEGVEGHFQIGAGNLDNVYGEAVLNMPLGESAAVRLALTSQDQDGYIRNILTGDNLMTSNQTLGRVRFRYNPSDTLDVNFAYDFRTQDNDLLFLEPDASYENAVGNPEAAPPFVVDQDADLIDENDGNGAGLTVDYTFRNDFVLSSITGFRTVERRTGSDEDATRVFTLDARYFVDDFEHFTQEVRLASPGDRAVRYVAGLFFFDQKAKTDRVVALGPGFGGPPEGVDAAIQDSSVDTSNFAVFVNGNADLSDRWTVSGGLRFTDESKDARIGQFVFPGFGLAQLIEESFSRDEDYVTATLNLQFQATDDVLTYFTYSNGYKAGGFNVDLVPTVDDLRFEEETVDSFELGMKSTLLDGKLRLNIAAFHATYEDYQVFQFRFDPFSGTTALLISNAAEVTTQGIEFEGVARIADNFELDYGFGFTDATFDDFPGGAVDPATGNPINVAGNSLARAPEFNASLTARVLFERGTAALNFTYRDDQYFNPDNRDNSLQKGYGLLNAFADYSFSDNLTVSIWGRNLADEEYRGMRGVSFLGVPFSLYLQPRTYGADITYRY